MDTGVKQFRSGFGPPSRVDREGLCTSSRLQVASDPVAPMQLDKLPYYTKIYRSEISYLKNREFTDRRVTLAKLWNERKPQR